MLKSFKWAYDFIHGLKSYRRNMLYSIANSTTQKYWSVKSFRMNGYTSGFHALTLKLEPLCTPCTGWSGYLGWLTFAEILVGLLNATKNRLCDYMTTRPAWLAGILANWAGIILCYRVYQASPANWDSEKNCLGTNLLEHQ